MMKYTFVLYMFNETIYIRASRQKCTLVDSFLLIYIFFKSVAKLQIK